MSKKQKLELTWIGKEDRPRLEPRILLEDPQLSHHAPHRVSEQDQFDNRLIKGDNLLALKALEQEFTGQVKCVYIDPPYNTGSAFTHYDDGLEHSIWLSMMRERLEILWRLLSSDGVIYCSIDSSELFYLGLLFDEIFGRQNRIEVLVWKKSYGGGAKSKYIVNQHEFIICYAKDLLATEQFFLPPDEQALKYYKFKDQHFESRGPYRLQPLATTSMDDRPNLRYAIIAEDGSEIWPEKQWQWSKERVLAAQAKAEIVITKKNGKHTVSYKQYLRGSDGTERQRKPMSIIDGAYTQHGTYESMELFGMVNKFSFPKPESLIYQLIESCTNPGDLVLDSFAGSGTTGAVAHKMNRRWIMVELGEHCDTHIVPRLRKVIDGEDAGGITSAVNWRGGGGFRYYRLADSLLKEDRWGNLVINRDYNAEMLSEAMCKLMGFRFAPSRDVYWQQGLSSERDYIYVTTAMLTHEQLAALDDEVGEERSLLVCCKAFKANVSAFQNLTVKKIPNAVLRKCEWNRDDYSLQVAELKPPEPAPNRQFSLFDEVREEVLNQPGKKKRK
ncbi:MAG: site-specific DNA-methyltransferase [Acidobacteriota bacterium]|nr:site-specific DNA-methyltransferase [Acidobacteriota bacterium]